MAIIVTVGLAISMTVVAIIAAILAALKPGSPPWVTNLDSCGDDRRKTPHT